MDIKSVILGFLEWKAVSGYELKKYFLSLDFIPWSGNNNQIYTSLLSLEKEGLVEKEIMDQDTGPSKKIYHITDAGREALKISIKTGIKKVENNSEFLLHIAWSYILNDREFTELLDEYQKNIEMEIKRIKEEAKRKLVFPGRTEREKYLWEMIWQNKTNLLKTELNWLVKLRNGIANK